MANARILGQGARWSERASSESVQNTSSSPTTASTSTPTSACKRGRSCKTNRMGKRNMEHMFCSASELFEGQVPEALQGLSWEYLPMALQ